MICHLLKGETYLEELPYFWNEMGVLIFAYSVSLSSHKETKIHTALSESMPYSSYLIQSDWTTFGLLCCTTFPIIPLSLLKRLLGIPLQHICKASGWLKIILHCSYLFPWSSQLFLKPEIQKFQSGVQWVGNRAKLVLIRNPCSSASCLSHLSREGKSHWLVPLGIGLTMPVFFF